MTASTVSARPGRPRLLELEQVVVAAQELADAEGLDAVSFRTLARELGVSPMAVHRTSGGIEALLHAVVSRSVAEAVREITWPDDWREVIRRFSAALRSLLLRHPAVLQAHQRAPLSAPEGSQAVEVVLAALERAGLARGDAVNSYVALHDYVTGHAALQLNRGDHVPLPDQLGERQTAARDLFEYPDYDRRFAAGIELLLGGIESLSQPR